MIKRRTSVIGEYEYVSQFDEAVDRSIDDFDERWGRYLDGADEPPLKPGSTPTIFRLRALGAREVDAVQSVTDDGDRAVLGAAFLLGAVGAKNWSRPGDSITFRRETSKIGMNTVSIVDMDALGDIDGVSAQAVMLDVGARVIRSMVPSPNS